METVKEKQLRILEETVEYYSQNPEERRCVNSKNGKCYYHGKNAQKKSEGCAVGRLLSNELQLELDENYTLNSKEDNSSVSGIFHNLPDDIKDLGKQYLHNLQQLHDQDFYWNNESGLSESGKLEYELIKNKINNNEYV